MQQFHKLRNISTTTWLLVFICLLASTLRFWRIETDPILGIDGAGYRAIALNLLDGHGFSSASSAPYAPTDFRSPLMPLFIAANYLLFGRSDYSVMSMHVLLDVLSCLMVFQIGKKLFGEKIGLIAAFLVATYIGSIVLTASLYTEPLYFFLIVLNAWLLIDYPNMGRTRIFIAGIVLGLATLARPLTILYPVFLAPAIFWLSPQKKRALANLAALGIGVVLVISPWVVRNKLVLDRWSLGDSAFFYVNIALGAKETFEWPPALRETFNAAGEGKLTAEQRALLPQQSIDEFFKRVDSIGWLGYLRVRASQVVGMWLYPAAGFLLIRDRGISMADAWQNHNYINLLARFVCLTIWGIFPALLTLLGFPRALKASKATLLLIVFAVFITLPNLVLQTDWRYAAPSFFLHAPIMAVGLVGLYSKLLEGLRRKRTDVPAK